MKQPYSQPTMDPHGSVVDLTRDLGEASRTDYIFNNTNETQFGIPPGVTVTGDGGSRDIIIEPAP